MTSHSCWVAFFVSAWVALLPPSLMKTLPSLLIVTDRGHFIAYRVKNNGSLDVLDSFEIHEGTHKLSEIVTDKAGAFPVSGSNGTSTASAERLPLLAELEMRTFRTIAKRITDLHSRYHPETWGFAAPGEINGAILDGLKPDLKTSLIVNLRLDLTGMPVNKVVNHFEAAAEKMLVS